MICFSLAAFFSAISLAVSVWCLEDPTFLVVWLESWGFTFHDYASFCGQATGGRWIKETGIFLFLLGLQFLCQRTGLGDQDWSESKPRRFPSPSAIHTTPFLLLRPVIGGLLWSFFFVHPCAASALEARPGDTGETKREARLCSGATLSSGFLSLSACYRFQVLRSICLAVLAALCGVGGCAYFILTRSLGFQSKSENEFPVWIFCFPLKKQIY